MKKFILMGIIIASVFGGYLFADDSYNTKVKEAISRIALNLKSTGYEVDYTKVKSSIIDDYISVENLSLLKDGETIVINSLKFHRDSFGSKQAKPEMVEFSIEGMKLSDNFGIDGAFDVYYIYKFDRKDQGFISKFDLKNEKSANFTASIDLKNAQSAWRCLNQNTKECEITMSPQSISNAIGDLKINNIDISFKNNGLIEKKLSLIDNLNENDFKEFAKNAIQNSTVTELNKKELIKFINNLDEININLTQNGTNVQDIVNKYFEKMKNGDFKRDKDFNEFILNQFEIVIK